MEPVVDTVVDEINLGRPRSVEAEAVVFKAIDEILAFNLVPQRKREEMWAISISLLKQLTGKGQPVVTRCWNARKDELDTHHRLFNLGKAHNRGKHISVLVEAIDLKS